MSLSWSCQKESAAYHFADGTNHSSLHATLRDDIANFASFSIPHLLAADSLWPDPVATYAWKSYFLAHDNTYIMNTLQRLRIKEIFLSPGDDTSLKTQDLIERCSIADISLARLLGENSYVQVDSGFTNLEQKLESFQAAGFEAIHLDIEPHALSDYKANIELYTTRFNNLILLSKQWCDQHDIDLSISIPMHTQPSTASLLAQLQIRSYIMAYENPDQAKLLTRTASLRNTLSGLYIWVVRAKDFTDLSHLQSEIAVLHQHGVYDLGIYDISEMDARY